MQCSPFTYRVHIYSVRIRLEFKRNKINQIKTNTIIMLLLQEEIFLVLSGIQACTAIRIPYHNNIVITDQ